MAPVFSANLLGHIPVLWPVPRRVACQRCDEDHGFHNSVFIKEKCPGLVMPGDFCVWVPGWLIEQVTSSTDSILSLERAADSTSEATGGTAEGKQRTVLVDL